MTVQLVECADFDNGIVALDTAGLAHIASLAPETVFIGSVSASLPFYASCVYFMQAIFVELPAFERHRSAYLDEGAFLRLQLELLGDPCCGAVIAGTGGLRKMRFGDVRRGKGKRGGLRIIYFWWERQEQFWLFAVYDKDEMEDLSAAQKKALKQMLERELEVRK